MQRGCLIKDDFIEEGEFEDGEPGAEGEEGVPEVDGAGLEGDETRPHPLPQQAGDQAVLCQHQVTSQI